MRSEGAGPGGSQGPAEASRDAIILPFRHRRRHVGIEGDFFRRPFDQQWHRVADMHQAGVPWWLIFRLINDREQR